MTLTRPSSPQSLNENAEIQLDSTLVIDGDTLVAIGPDGTCEIETRRSFDPRRTPSLQRIPGEVSE